MILGTYRILLLTMSSNPWIGEGTTFLSPFLSDNQRNPFIPPLHTTTPPKREREKVNIEPANTLNDLNQAFKLLATFKMSTLYLHQLAMELAPLEAWNHYADSKPGYMVPKHV